MHNPDNPSRIIIYGGTFDPIHNGHINVAINIQQHFHFDKFIFLPCKIPVLKQEATASAAQRVHMLHLALDDQDPHFSINLSEINRDSPSYTITSLESFRAKYDSTTAITALLGMDAFLSLPMWKNWQDILTLANLLVIKRTGFNNLPVILQNLLHTHGTLDASSILNSSHGMIYLYDAGKFDISSTWIKQQLTEKHDVSAYLPPNVFQYIQENNIYT